MAGNYTINDIRMKTTFSTKKILYVILLSLCFHSSMAQRWMENLDRGVVAVKQSNTSAFISWRILGTDPQDIAFNIYRKTGNGSMQKLNSEPVTGGTNWVDNNNNLSQDNSYYVEPIVNGQTWKHSLAYILKGDAHIGQYLKIPLKAVGIGQITDWYVHFTWVGDLDGDGEYDFVVDRNPSAGGSVKVDAYLRDGRFLWRADTGPNGEDLNGIEGGPTAISNGHWDGVTVYDLNNDGKAEVVIKTANNFVFGDGKVLRHSNNNDQFLSVLSGMTGAELARIQLPADYKSDGPLQTHMGIAYLDGVNPSIIVKAKNRIGNGGFNLLIAAYSFLDGTLKKQWQWNRNNTTANDFHQIRTLDIDGDGKDEICDGGYVIDDNGRFLYAIPGIIHGDRFHISDFDPSRPGLEGFGIQQNNPGKLATYYYDAATGNVLRTHYTSDVVDAARGVAADVDPTRPGYEYWSFYGMHNAATGQLVDDGSDTPWPNFKIWWDGDLLSENLNRELVEKWNHDSKTCCTRLLSANRDGAVKTWRDAPTFYGDILGDWREEIIWEHYNRQELLIFTTIAPTNHRLYTLAHNPAYRLSFTYKGYMQPGYVDYYLGEGMSVPPAPNIKIIGGKPDCYGEVNGDAYLDDCNECVGGRTGRIACKLDCNGVRNGTAVLDACGICTGGNTGRTACLVSVQGEDFCEADGFLESKNAGFTGEGYINFDNISGAVGRWNLYATSSMTAVIGVRYANGGTEARGMSVLVNGIAQASIKGSLTGGWTTWATENITLNLRPGVNVLELKAVSPDGPNIDLFALYQSGLTSGGCVEDCNGVTGGGAYTDQCGVCVGGTTGKTACEQDCAGIWGGDAEEDACGVCLGSNGAYQPCSGSLEAEEACDVDGILPEDRNGGFSGAGYVNTTNALGSYVTWFLESDKTQTATLSFRYANAGVVSRDGRVILNGADAGLLALPSTGSWSDWKLATMLLELKEGINELTLASVTEEGLANLDILYFSGGVSNGGCMITGISGTLPDQIISVYPNPTTGMVRWESDKNWILLNAQGKMLNRGLGNSADLSEYPSGLYMLKLDDSFIQIVRK